METWLALATTNSALVRTGFCMTGGCLGFCSLVSAACVMGLHLGVGRRLRLARRLMDGVGREWIYPPVDPLPLPGRLSRAITFRHHGSASQHRAHSKAGYDGASALPSPRPDPAQHGQRGRHRSRAGRRGADAIRGSHIARHGHAFSVSARRKQRPLGFEFEVRPESCRYCREQESKIDSEPNAATLWAACGRPAGPLPRPLLLSR